MGAGGDARPARLPTFEVAKLLDYRERMAELEASENPFALVVLAHLYTKATRNNQVDRRHAKLRLIRLLLERGYDTVRIRQLFGVLDRMLKLSPQQAIIFRREVEDLKEGKVMAYLTVWEQEAQAKGMEHGFQLGREQGVQLGRQQGVELGRQQGVELGLQQGIERVLSGLLSIRFGELPDWALARLRSASTESLELWSRRVLDARSLEDVFV